MRVGLRRLQQCDSVQCIVFDSMDIINFKLFRDIVGALQSLPQQVCPRAHPNEIEFRKIRINSLHLDFQIIVTSKYWRPVHTHIFNEKSKDYLIFGTSLDIAMAANTRFDAMFVNKPQHVSSNMEHRKLQSILSMFGFQI